MLAVTEVEPGHRLPSRAHEIDQGMIIRYAGASGDFNPLHWDADVAARVSPTGGIIAHGMLSMGLVSALVTDWAGGPDNVVHLSASFRAPCPVGATLAVGGEVTDVDAEAGTATLAVWAETEDGARVVDRRASRATVRLAGA